MLGACFFFCVMNAIAKYLSDSHTIIEIAFYRNLVALLPFVLLALAMPAKAAFIPRQKPGLVIGRALLGVLSLSLTFAAYSVMAMAETAVLLFTVSFFMPILGALLLGERVSRARWLTIAIGFVGVVLIASPRTGINLLGVGLALTAAVAQAFMSIMLRSLRGAESSITISLYFFAIGTLVAGLFVPIVGVRPTPGSLLLLVGAGLAGACAQWLYTMALRYTPTATIAVLNYTGILWAGLLGWLIWGDVPTGTAVVGALVIVATTAWMALRERQTARRPKTDAKP
jgi:drug/metabolite transporter (DMT)-like permease